MYYPTSAGELISLNYSLSLVNVVAIPLRNGKTIIQDNLKTFFEKNFNQLVLPNIVLEVFDALSKNDTVVRRFDRHTWTVSIFVVTQSDSYLIDCVDWGLTFMSKTERAEFNVKDQPEIDDIVTHFNKSPKLAALMPMSPTIIFQSRRLYDSLYSIFAFETLVESHPVCNLDLVLVAGRYFANSDYFAAPRPVDTVRIVGATEIDSVLERAQVADVVRCLRFPKESWRKDYIVHFRRFVQSCVTAKSKNGALARERTVCKIFISLELEKRYWLEQIEGYQIILSRAAELFGNVKVFVNGMTGPLDGEGAPEIEKVGHVERGLISEIAKALSDSVEFVSLQGLTIIDKIGDLSDIDFFVSPIGTACAVPASLGIRGIVYGPREFFNANSWQIDDLPNVYRLDPKFVMPSAEELSVMNYDWSRSDGSNSTYSINPILFLEHVETALGWQRSDAKND